MKYLLFLTAFVCTLSVSAQTSDSPYEDEFEYSDGLSRVYYKGKYGYIDEKKKEVIDLKYLRAKDFKNGIAQVSLDGKYFGFINKQGKTVIPLEFEDFGYEFRDGVINAKKQGKWGLLNNKGKILVPFQYDYIRFPEDGLSVARIKKGEAKVYGVVDENGKTVVPFEYDDIEDYSEGLARVRKNGLFGFIDKKGKIVIPITYPLAKNFSDGLAAVSNKEKKWGFIDKSNAFVIRPAYNQVVPFKGGEAEVLLGTDAYFIDKTGKKLGKGRWLFHFTKGIKHGEQFWYRGADPGAQALKDKFKEGFRYYDVVQNHHKREYFIVMSKFSTSWQSGIFYRYDGDKIWDKIKEQYKDNRNITALSYGVDKWSMISSSLYTNPGEGASTNSSFPFTSIEEAKKKRRFVTNLAYGDGRWIVVMRGASYTDQFVRLRLGGWDQEEVDEQEKKGYYPTSVAVEDNSYYIIFTKGAGIKEQVFLWSEDIPMREINQFWDKGYQSFRTYYLPRNTTLNKDSGDDWDFLF